MMRLFLVILMTFVFNFSASAQIRFYCADNIETNKSSYVKSMHLVYTTTYTRWGYYISDVFFTSGSATFWEVNYSKPNCFYGTELQKSKLEGVIITTKCANHRYEYKQVYRPEQIKPIFYEYKEDLYKKGMLLYTDGATVEMIKKQNRTLLKIKSVKLCSEFYSQRISLGTNWTNAQFMRNIYQCTPEQFALWSKQYKQDQNNATDVVFPAKKKISVLEVTFTNNQKVKLQTYEDSDKYGKPAWINARPGMLVERFKVRQITVYKLK